MGVEFNGIKKSHQVHKIHKLIREIYEISG